MSHRVQIKPSRKPQLANMRTSMPLYVLIAPALTLIFIFSYIPMYGVLLAFKDFSPYVGFIKSPWVGFEHFEYFLTDRKFWHVMRNTLIINFYDIAFGFTAPIIFALLANEIMNKPFKRTMQTISYLPHFLSWVVVSGLFYRLLSPTDGIVNELVKFLGGESIYFMTEKEIFRGILVFADIWKGVGWSAILYFSVISGIDLQLYDAARIDGAGRFKQALHVTLPGLLPMIVLLFLLRLASIFGIGFERIFLMYNSLVYDKADVISTYTYRLGIEQAQFSLTTAIGLSQSLLGFILLTTSNRVSKKIAGMGLY